MPQKKRSNKYCIRCNTEFYPKSAPQVFCGGSCRSKTLNSSIKVKGSGNPNWKGGMSAHPLYQIYFQMISRCYRIDHVRYHDYGGRGIGVCQSWRDSFWCFVGDVGKRPEGGIMDRIDNDGNYEPSNFRWADIATSAKNRRRFGYEKRFRNTKGQFI